MLRMSFAALSVVALSGCWLAHRTSEDETSLAMADGGADAGLGQGGPPESRCSEQILAAGQQYLPVDMVWVVDSSNSMRDEQSRIRSTINQFVADAVARSYDVRLVMITNEDIVPAPLGSDAARYRFAPRAVPSHQPLQALLEALPEYADFLRPEAALHFVAVTDDDSELPAADFRAAMDRALARPYTFHAVASPDVDGRPCSSQTPSEACLRSGRQPLCGAAAVGRQYLELASELGGEQISICIDDWREVFGPLLEAVTPTAIPCSIELPAGPAEPASQYEHWVEVDLVRGASLQALQHVPDASACGRLRAFYVEARAETRVLSLCPVACGATSLAGVEVHVRSDCR